jgi:two-component system, NtrC family, sensor kinase
MRMALQTSRSDLAFEHLPQPIVVMDEEGRVERVNLAAEPLVGGPVGARGARSERVEDALPWLAAAVRRVLAGADEVGVEAEAATGEGRRAVAARVRRLRGPSGASGAVALIEDLAARREVESRLRDSERLDALGTLAAGLAHEVNNPLAAVVAGLAFVKAEHTRLAETLSPAELQDAQAALEEARAAALRVGRIVRSLESFGRPASPLAQPVDVTAVVRDAVAAAERASLGRPRLVAVLAAPALVRGGEPLIAEVVDALLSNALQAAAGGDPEVAVVHVAVSASASAVHVVVSDTGPGIPQRIQQRVFEPFFTTRAPGRGAGLGLSVCHGIVGALGGTLSLESAPGAGTTVTVTLPLASQRDAEQPCCEMRVAGAG